MLHRSLIDGRPVNINDIDRMFMLPSPLFTGFGGRPRLVIRTLEDDSIQIVQPAASGEDLVQLKENEEWQNIEWYFKSDKDFVKHRTEDEENVKLYYVVGVSGHLDSADTLTGITLYILKKGSEKRCKRYCYRHDDWWVKLDFYLSNWQIPLFTILGALIGASVAVMGNILLEIAKHCWLKE